MSLASLFKWGKQSDEMSPPATGAMPKHRDSNARYAIDLHRGGPESVDPSAIVRAWESLEEDMALFPAGEVAPRAELPHDERPPFVTTLYIDRFAVTNHQFAEFVADGGYDAADLWPEEVWPTVTQFVDRSGYPGPRYWEQGRAAKKLADHPVTGVCWYEANAYALWVGKRLPSSFEWERAGTWPTNLDDQSAGVRFPWGNSFDTECANTWNTAVGTTVKVNAYPRGSTPNGVYQLIGNVWEWVADEYHGPAVRDGLKVHLDQQMAEVRGGAYDTYFDSQTTCRFRTGQPIFFRGPNVGFRCAVSADDLRRPADVSALT